MHPVVAKKWFAFSTGFEGAVSWMYVDIYGFVTTAIGNLIDTPGEAAALPWVHKTNFAPATRGEIIAEWNMVKSDAAAARLGHRSLEAKTNLRLLPAALEQCVLTKVAINDGILRGRFPSIDEWPVDAILATHSLAWACGANFRFPALAASLNVGDFARAAIECRMDTRGPDKIEGTADDNRGIIPRNTANAALYRAAAAVKALDLPFDVLHWLDHDKVEIPKAVIGEYEVVVVETLRDFDIVHPRLDLVFPEREV